MVSFESPLTVDLVDMAVGDHLELVGLVVVEQAGDLEL